MENDNSWFDQKYREGGRPTLEDRAQLFSQLDIPLPERTIRKAEEQLKECLFQLGRQYTPSLHVKTYGLLFCFGSFLKLDKKSYDNYVAQYRAALEKHKDRVVFDCNFK